MQEQVWIVDDDQAVRNSLRMLLKSSGFTTREFDSADSLLEEQDFSPCYCLLLDIRLPGISGLELHQQLEARGVQTPAIFITGHGDIPMAVQAMQQGAVDFLTKPLHDAELIDKVQAAIALAREQRDKRQQETAVHESLATLTDREREVMAGIVRGLSNKQIAAELSISPRTVEVHRAHTMEKMNVNSVANLVRLLGEAGLIDE